MIYVYAFTSPLPAPPAVQGIDDAPVSVLTLGDVSAVYSELATTDVAPTSDSLWSHDRVVEELMASGSVAPARFATTFGELEELRQALTRETEALAASLERVRGCVELAVRVGVDEPIAPSPGTDGGAYLRQRLAVLHRHQRFMRDTLGPLDDLAVASRGAAGASPEGTIKVAYLIRSDRVIRFSEVLRRLQVAHRELTVSCTGPWAPYSFVGEPAS